MDNTDRNNKIKEILKKSIEEPNWEKNDYGFSVIENKKAKAEKTDLLKVVKELKQLIMPLLVNLRDSSDKGDTIYWPGRKTVIQEQIDKIEKLTEGL